MGEKRRRGGSLAFWVYWLSFLRLSDLLVVFSTSLEEVFLRNSIVVENWISSLSFASGGGGLALFSCFREGAVSLTLSFSSSSCQLGEERE